MVNNPASSNKIPLSSEGFDLDATTGKDGDQDVVFELGGGVTTTTTAATIDASQSLPEHSQRQQQQPGDTTIAPPVISEQTTKASPLALAEEFKIQGNQEFQNGNYLEAIDMYTHAIDATPDNIPAEELFARKEKWDQEQTRLIRAEMTAQDEEARRRRQTRQDQDQQQQSTNTSNGGNDDDEGGERKDGEGSKKSPVATAFEAPPHAHAKELAIYYGNRAAAYLHLKRYDDAIQDCHVAILWNPTYTKAYVRRCMAYEAIGEKTDLALADAQRALQLEPSNIKLQQTAQRLQKIEHERLETLKAETMEKLKELGNSILGNFGLSLDNFKAEKDSNTGSYSISFNQNSG